jgi:hypothetical protein
MERDRDLLPVPEKDFLTREEALRDDTVDINEKEDKPSFRREDKEDHE